MQHKELPQEAASACHLIDEVSPCDGTCLLSTLGHCYGSSAPANGLHVLRQQCVRVEEVH